MEFAHRSLLLGALAVLHYNSFSRAVAVLFAKITGIPVLGYCDDCGALVPSEVLGRALNAFMAFPILLWVKLKGPKTEKGQALTCFGVFGEFHAPRNNAPRPFPFIGKMPFLAR